MSGGVLDQPGSMEKPQIVCQVTLSQTLLFEVTVHRLQDTICAQVTIIFVLEEPDRIHTRPHGRLMALWPHVIYTS